MKNHKVLLAGASGYLGRFIANELEKQGYPVRIILRNRKNIPFDTKNMEVVWSEVTKPESLTGILEGIDVVISTVGITKQKDGFTYMDVDYQANKNLLEESKKAGAKKFIYVSAFNADKIRHLKIAAAKEKFVDELKSSGLDYCIIRPNGFFSDMTEFLKMAKKGKAELFGDGNYKMNPIHGKDLAIVCVNSIESEKNVVDVGGPKVFTHNEIVELAFNTMDKKVKIRYMPEWIRRMILWSARTFTSSKKYGPMEFFFTVLAMDMVAPAYGEQRLSVFFDEMKTKI
jgi:uncharacterized protein YbjT (DUF2867 family)